jgi:hypothetical protein
LGNKVSPGDWGLLVKQEVSCWRERGFF